MDSSIAYFVISAILFLFSYKLSRRPVENTSKGKLTRLRRGKAYLRYLLDQHNKSLLKDKPAEQSNALKEIQNSGNDNVTAIPFFTIVYATQSNTSKKFADRLQSEAESVNLKCQIKNVSEVSVEDFNKNVYIVFLLSTYGEGGPTDDCIEFLKNLENRSLFEEFNNKELCYSIFGLGSSKYENYNAISRKADKILKKMGLTCISTAGEGDDAKDINKDYENWLSRFWQDCVEFFGTNKEKVGKLSEKLNLKELYENKKEEYEIILKQGDSNVAIVSAIENNDYDFNLKRFMQCPQCEIADIVELRKQNVNGSTLKIVYNLSGSGLTYRVGDNLGVYPVNSESAVQKLLNRLNYDPKLMVSVKKLKEDVKKKLSIPDSLTIEEILTNLIDLSASINKEMIEKFTKYCYDEDQYEALQVLIKREGKFAEFSAKNQNLVDFITTYDSISVPFLEFYNIAQKITPRFYTVASSPNYTQNKVEIIVSLVEWSTSNGEKRYGLTSCYFKTILENFKLNSENRYKSRILIRDSSFRLPEDHTSPMLMICTGTGIAPYISFLQEFDSRKNLETSLPNPNQLIFGSKNKDYDFIYETELNGYVDKKVLHKYSTAFSRDQEKKRYVQHIIEEIKHEVDALLENPGSRIYICGGVSMGAEVTTALENHYSKEVVKKLEKDGRLVKELWG